MRAYIFAAGDPYAAEADFENHSAGETVLQVVRRDVDVTEFRRCDDDLSPRPRAFSTERAGGGTMRVIFAVYA